MKKFSIKFISIILTIAILLVSLPLTVFAVANEDSYNNISSAESAESSLGNITTDIYELTDRRDEYTKHFRLEDGSFVAAQYDVPVHYLDEDSKWQDIDNSLSDSGSEFETSNAKIKFAKKINGNENLFTIHEDNRKITMSLNGAIKKTEGNVIQDNASEESLTKLQKMMALDKLSSTIRYEDILQGVDIEYIVESNYVKENIIVKEKQNDYSYSFTLKLNNLEASLNKDGSISIIEPNANTIVFYIPAPIVYDNNYEYASCDQAWYSLVRNGTNEYTLSIIVDSDWMNSEKRAYPVIVDPTVYKGGHNMGQMRDTYVSSKNPTTGYGSQTTLRAGYDSTYGYTRAYVYLYPKPTLPKGSYITSAQINLQISSINTSDSILLGAYTIDMGTTSVWSESGTTWNTHSAQFSDLLDHKYIESVPHTYDWSWDITEAAKKWYAGTLTDQGICIGLVEETGTTDNYIVFHSSESTMGGSSTYLPFYCFTYRDTKGIEDYYSYFSSNVGLAGNGSINYATGGLTFTKALLSTTDSLMPYTPTLVYNSPLSGLPYQYSNNIMTAYTTGYMPYGFKFNMQETIIKKTYTSSTNSTKYHYIWSDADGTEHYFHLVDGSSTEYRDEDGLQLVLNTSSSTTLTITDNSKTVRKFTKITSPPSGTSGAWYLTSITDVNNNAISFTIDSSFRPTTVSLTPNGSGKIDFLTILYNSSNMPYLIWNTASNEAIVFRYSSTYSGSIASTSTKYLRQLVYAHGNDNVTTDNWLNFYNSSSNTTNITVDATVNYTYDSSGRLTVVKDSLSGYEVRYTYTNGRVTTVQEYANSSTAGQKVSLTYYSGYTEVRSSGSDDIYNNSDDIITVYILDDELRVKSTYSTDSTRTKLYGAVSGEYETRDSIKNNLKSTTTVGGSATNHLLNGGFELGTSTSTISYWSKTSNVSRELKSTGGLSGWYDAKFTPKAGIKDIIYQYVFLPAGTYTMSMLLDTLNAKNVKVYIKAVSQSSSNLSYTEEFSANEFYVSDAPIEVSMQIKSLNVTNGGEVYKVSIEVVGESDLAENATVNIDNVMLEMNVGSSNYSLVEFGNFESTAVNSSGTPTVGASTFWTTYNSDLDIQESGNTTFGNAARITGTINSLKYIKQRIYTADASVLESYDNGTGYFDDVKTYIVSGFAKTVGETTLGTVFRLSVEVNYYQGSERDQLVRTYQYNFEKNSDVWQFVCGTFNTPDGLVHSIDIYCEYGYSFDGYAMFDNISVVLSDDGEYESYGYYTSSALDGLMKTKQNGRYIEYYEYNGNRKLTRVANNNGEICDYIYDTNGINVISEIYYHFTYNGTTNYPIYNSNRDTLITKTPLTRTDYTYNSYGLILSSDTYEATYSGTNVVAASGAKHIVSSYTYNIGSTSKIFGSLAAESDNRGIVTWYYYNSDDGRLRAVINQTGVNQNEGTGICYTYDAVGNISSVMPATYTSSSAYSEVTTSEKVEYTYDTANRLDSIKTKSSTYNFNYDVFGNTTSIAVGNTSLASYTYNSYNGKLKTLTYGNGTTLRYVYDELDNIKEIWYNNGSGESKAYEYFYTSFGQLARFDNLLTGMSTVYRYDGWGRLLNITEYDTDDMKNVFSSNMFYNTKAQLAYLVHTIDYAYSSSNIGEANLYYYYVYTSDGDLERTNVEIGNITGNINYAYDDFDRLENKTYSYTKNSGSTYTNTVEYTYVSGTNISNTTALVRTFESTVGGTNTTYTYTYDSNGNVTKITSSTGAEYRYFYDDLGQLVREDNTVDGVTYVYSYDKAGNITSKYIHELTAENGYLTSPISFYSYTYGNSNWGDLLTNYNGGSITYDAIGNPTSYYNGTRYTFTWEQGRRLATAVKGSNSLSFTYNDEGIRTSKTVNGVVHTYHLAGSRIIAEEWGNNLIIYLYDAEGTPIGMQYRNSMYGESSFDTYWFEKNLQGDIVAVYNENGTKLVSYTYDAWGNVTTTYHNSGASTAAQYNPFRYRGYYYDSELGFYYLNSRYYDSETGRFLNADKFVNANGDMTGFNMFAYCGNDPTTNYDKTGEKTWSIGWSFSAVFVGGITYSLNWVFDDNGNVALQISEANIAKDFSGATIGLWSIGISRTYSYTVLDSVDDLEGNGISAGGTIPFICGKYVSADVILSMDSQSEIIGGSLSAGISAGVDAHVTVSKTTTVAKFNIVDTAKNIWKAIKSWFGG